MEPTTGRETDPVAEPAGGRPLSAARRRMVRAFPWHAGIVLAGNLLLNAANALAGGPWWAFWPLVITGLALGIHYLFYKAARIDERWVRERTEELNLKSYDRGHIEDLKSRYDDTR